MSKKEDQGDRPSVRPPIEKKQIREDTIMPEAAPDTQVTRPLVRPAKKRK